MDPVQTRRFACRVGSIVGVGLVSRLGTSPGGRAVGWWRCTVGRGRWRWTFHIVRQFIGHDQFEAFSILSGGKGSEMASKELFWDTDRNALGNVVAKRADHDGRSVGSGCRSGTVDNLDGSVHDNGPLLNVFRVAVDKVGGRRSMRLRESGKDLRGTTVTLIVRVAEMLMGIGDHGGLDTTFNDGGRNEHDGEVVGGVVVGVSQSAGLLLLDRFRSEL